MDKIILTTTGTHVSLETDQLIYDVINSYDMAVTHGIQNESINWDETEAYHDYQKSKARLYERVFKLEKALLECGEAEQIMPEYKE